jgi:hypothetical protein
MTGKWLIATWLNGDDKPDSSEARGPFSNEETRDEMIDELQSEDPSASLVIVRVEVEGDDEASLEIGDPV